jgi:hypothetical protein
MYTNIWLIGTVLKKLNVPFIVIGRSEFRCLEFEAKVGVRPISGGIQNFLITAPVMPSKVIITTKVEELQVISKLLMDYGVKNILAEKPGVAYVNEINELVDLAKKTQTNLLIAYNRRFYASVLKAEKIIEEDGGVSSFNFEFTEWSHIISTLKETDAGLHNWFLGNSTHVIDLAFYLGGFPKQFSAYYKGSLNWHPTASAYAGAGISETGALFSYHANWEAPGRWVLEVLTTKHRLIFKPMEKLQIQAVGSVAINPVEINDSLDISFKPGIYLQTKAFIENDYTRFCNIYDQQQLINDVYTKMSGY